MEKRLKTFVGLKVGNKIIVRSNSNSHNYPMDIPLTLKINGTGVSMNNCVEGGTYNTLNASDCVLISIRSIKDIKKERECKLKELKTLEEQIAFCEENELEEYDDVYFKVSEILKALESKKLSKNEKIMKITELVKEI